MNLLPSHASREMCERIRNEMRGEIDQYDPDCGWKLSRDALVWLLDECDWLTTEPESAWAELKKGQRRRTPTRCDLDEAANEIERMKAALAEADAQHWREQVGQP